jgi:HTH-type transcriptional regulator/antitoxin HigA
MARSRSYIATPPGTSIQEQLEDRKMSVKEFAAKMNMSEEQISRLICGEARVTPDCALRLEKVFGVPAKFWSSLEAIYREKLAKVEAENAMEHNTADSEKRPSAKKAKFD